MMATRILIGLACAFAVGMPASAQTDITGAPSEWRGTPIDGSEALVSTNKYGEPQFVTVRQAVAAAFIPSVIRGDRLADEFKLLCLDTGFDSDKLSDAVAKSGFKFTGKSLTIDAVKKGKAPYVARIWHADEARVQIWTGDTTGLDGYPSISRWRRGATITPFNASRAMVPSCGLTIMARGFRSPDEFLKRLESIIGQPGTKIVTKPEWADGYWSLKDASGVETRISYSMVDFDKAEQLLHVSFATVPSKAKKK
jgi:hypothetical protein